MLSPDEHNFIQTESILSVMLLCNSLMPVIVWCAHVRLVTEICKTHKWIPNIIIYLCNNQRKSDVVENWNGPNKWRFYYKVACLSRSHFGKNINRNVSSSKPTREELDTCTALSDKFLWAHIPTSMTYIHCTSRSRHEHIMQIQTFYHQYTNLITNRWVYFTRSPTNLWPPHQDQIYVRGFVSHAQKELHVLTGILIRSREKTLARLPLQMSFELKICYSHAIWQMWVVSLNTKTFFQ